MIQSGKVEDYWCLIDYVAADGASRTYLVEFDKKQAADALNTMKSLLGDKVVVPTFEAAEHEVAKAALPPLPQVTVTVHKDRVPSVPEPRSDMALVVVVCPSVDVSDAGKGSAYVLAVDGKVVTANKMGTYSAFFIEPGRHTLLSVHGKGSQVEMELQLGQEYFFFQDTLSDRNVITQHTKALVMNELAGSYAAEWALKQR